MRLTLTLKGDLQPGEVGTRTLTIEPGKKVPIGRSSSVRSDAAAAPNNALIDSPVVSRSHAYFVTQANPEPPGNETPIVYIVDEKSMHGTRVNGVRLQKMESRPVHTGDVITLGVNVVRGNGELSRLRCPFNANSE